MEERRRSKEGHSKGEARTTKEPDSHRLSEDARSRFFPNTLPDWSEEPERKRSKGEDAWSEKIPSEQQDFLKKGLRELIGIVSDKYPPDHHAHR